MRIIIAFLVTNPYVPLLLRSFSVPIPMLGLLVEPTPQSITFTYSLFTDLLNIITCPFSTMMSPALNSLLLIPCNFPTYIQPQEQLFLLWFLS